MKDHETKEGKSARRRNDDQKDKQGQDVRKRMQALLDTIDYDFSQFTLEDFRSWLEQRRGRKIDFVPCHILSSRMSGAWLPVGDCDYVFYEVDTLPIHQAHIQLHEMAHMLCDHPTLKVSPDELEGAFRNTIETEHPEAISSLLLRSVHRNDIELEAETIASLIQERALRHSRLQGLTQAVSPSEGFTGYFSDYIRTLGDK